MLWLLDAATVEIEMTSRIPDVMWGQGGKGSMESLEWKSSEWKWRDESNKILQIATSPPPSATHLSHS